MESIVTKMHRKILEKKLIDMIEEDLGSGDVTSAFVPNKKVEAEIIALEPGILAGAYEAGVLFDLFNIEILNSAEDGTEITQEKQVFSLSGYSRDILCVERTALNILSRMSGIATLAGEFVEKAREANPAITVAATRKTTPQFRYFEKKAVQIGGGDPHRFGLYDAVLIKDNHLKLFNNITDALNAAKRKTSFTQKIEIEVDNMEDAILAAKNNADVIMLDNMPAKEIKKLVSVLDESNLRKSVLLEASGGINLGNIQTYAGTGVDVISIGMLTHSAKSLDFTLEIKK